jgi:hypothetical protein
MRPDSKRDFLLRWAAIATAPAALPTLTDTEIAAVAGGIGIEPLYGVRVPPPPPHGGGHPEPLYGVRPVPVVPPGLEVEYGPAIPG